MNERILELAKQAGYAPLPGFDFANELQEVFLKKFAQLIVRECIDVIGEENYTMLTGKAYCVQLKRHFEVEE